MFLQNPAANRNALRVFSSRCAAHDNSALETRCLAKGESGVSPSVVSKGSGIWRSGFWIPSERSFLTALNSSLAKAPGCFVEAASFSELSMARY